MKKNYLRNSVFFVASLFFAFSLGLISHGWGGFTAKYEIDVFSQFTQFLTLIITILLAYWVSNILDKDNHLSRIEKDFVIRRNDEFLSFLDINNGTILTGTISYSDAASIIKKSIRLNNSILNLILKTGISVESTFHGIIQAEILILKPLLTYTPPLNSSPDPNPALVVLANQINYSQLRINEIDNQIDKVKTLILEYSIFINRC